MTTTTANGKYFCHVCQINLNSEANYALHGFDDKHCENLLKVSKNKPPKAKTTPVNTKPAVAPATPATSCYEETPSVNPSLYGYFDAATFGPKEFNTEYDPYLQKLAENPLKPPPPPPVIPTDFSSGKKKKKRVCEICEVTLSTVPAFQAHMTSAAHIYRLKMLGMGVSAHFVKASSNLHTTDLFVREDGSSDDGEAAVSSVSGPIAKMSSGEYFCDTCSLTLNSKLQYDAHLIGKSHFEKVNKKMNPLNFIKCYTCNIQLGGICVFNDHKAGKKHRNKCLNLIRNGYTIPPEERPPELMHKKFAEPAMYPELYVKEVLEKDQPEPETQELAPAPIEAAPIEETTPEQLMPPPPPPPPKPDINLSTGLYHCSECSNKFTTASKLQLHQRSIHPHAVVNVVAFQMETQPVESAEPPVPGVEETVLPERELECSVCEMTFSGAQLFNHHFKTEEHAEKVWELKMSGTPVGIIVDKLMADRKYIKSFKSKFFCGICNVFTNNGAENRRHVESDVHKASTKALAKDLRLILMESIPRGEDGKFPCTKCNESFPSVLQFNTHLTAGTHSAIKNQERKRRFIVHALRLNSEKNPGVRTKIPGQAIDVSTGMVERVPNLEPLEPKIDDARNVNVGITMPDMPARVRMPVQGWQPQQRFAPYPQPLMNNSRPSRQWGPQHFGPPRFNQPWQWSRGPRPRFPPQRFNDRPPRQGGRGSYPY